MNKIRKVRIPAELQQLQKAQNTHGIKCTAKDESSDDYSQLIARIPGPKGSPYDEGIFEVSIAVGEQYPFQPPTFRFLTPVFHPNIDQAGKICLDLLRMPPTGSYNPAITLESILISIQLLLATPNPDDPLHGDAADLYKKNREQFDHKAKEIVRKYQSNGKSLQVKDEENQLENAENVEVLEKVVAKRKKLYNLPSF